VAQPRWKRGWRAGATAQPRRLSRVYMQACWRRRAGVWGGSASERSRSAELHGNFGAWSYCEARMFAEGAPLSRYRERDAMAFAPNDAAATSPAHVLPRAVREPLRSTQPATCSRLASPVVVSIALPKRRAPVGAIIAEERQRMPPSARSSQARAPVSAGMPMSPFAHVYGVTERASDEGVVVQQQNGRCEGDVCRATIARRPE